MVRRNQCLLVITVILCFSVEIKSQESLIDPIQLLPDNTANFVKVDHPVKLIESMLKYAQAPEVTAMQIYKDATASSNFRKAKQFIEYAQKKFGKPWRTVLEETAGTGIVIANQEKKVMTDPDVNVIIIQGNDAVAMEKLIEFAVDVFKEEVTRQEGKPFVTIEKQDKGKTWKINGGYSISLLNKTIIAGNINDYTKQAIDKYTKSLKETLSYPTQMEEGRKLAFAENQKPLIWAWVNLGYYAREKEIKEHLYTYPTNDPVPHVIFGGWFDIGRGSKCMVSSLQDSDTGPILQVQLPSGREQMTPVIREAFTSRDATHAPRPLLKMDGLIYSTSFTWNFSTFWNRRSEFVSPNVVKEWEEADKKSSPGLMGKKLSDLLQQFGSRHRFVIAQNDENGYQMKAKVAQPAYAVIFEARDTEKLQKMIEPPLRAAGFIASAAVGMKLFEDTHQNTKIIGYRFHETEKNRLYADGTLFNYTPCFARIGDQFILSSTHSLCKKVIDAVRSEREQVNAEPYVEGRHWMSWTHLSSLAYSNLDELMTRAILHFGGDAEVAKTEIENGAKLLDRLGIVEAKVIYEPNQFKIRLQNHWKK